MDTEKKLDAGQIAIIGIGPGSSRCLTPDAKKTIKESEVVIGYKTYIDLITFLIKEKQIVSTSMRQEVERCDKAINLAIQGKKIALVSSGDPGIYGMAGLVFELLRQRYGDGTPEFGIKVIPGISALNSCAALLGAPLMHDFAAISLSDLLTPWQIIEKRINAAASTDFIIVLYNPKSKGRTKQIVKAAEIISRYRSSDTPVGIVKNSGRKGETVNITMLNRLVSCSIDMQSTVIIGNSKTFIWNRWMVTPRGYENKYIL